MSRHTESAILSNSISLSRLNRLPRNMQESKNKIKSKSLPPDSLECLLLSQQALSRTRQHSSRCPEPGFCWGPTEGHLQRPVVCGKQAST